MTQRPGVPAERSPAGADRPNPEPFEGSLVWWIEVPGTNQNYLQGVLEGHEELGYYQTLDQCVRRGADKRPIALGRITSTPDMRGRLKRLLEIRLRAADRSLRRCPSIENGAKALMMEQMLEEFYKLPGQPTDTAG